MKANTQSAGSLFFLLALFFALFIFIIGKVNIFIGIDLANTHPTPDHNILQASPPKEVSIELTDAQLIELTEAYENGFDNPEPDDPCQRLQLLPYKKLSTWRKQFRKRGFTIEKIKDMLAHGRRAPFTHPEKGVTYTKIFDTQGNWIVVDFVDCIVWQVAPYNFK